MIHSCPNFNALTTWLVIYIPLQWPHMIVKVSQFMGDFNICSTVLSNWEQRKHQFPLTQVVGGFPSQRASNVESHSMSWLKLRHGLVITTALWQLINLLLNLFLHPYPCLTVCLWTLIAKFMGPTGTDRTQVGPMLGPWILLCRSTFQNINFTLSNHTTMSAAEICNPKTKQLNLCLSN